MGAAKLPSPWPSSTLTVSTPNPSSDVTTRSSLPSAFRSPLVVDHEYASETFRAMAAAKVPSPLPSRMLTSLFSTPRLLAVARSILPSALKSPAARENVYGPVAKVRAGWKLPLPLPSSTLTLPSAVASS